MIIKELMERIAKKIPNLKNHFLFYDDGFIYRFFFKNEVNVPELSSGLQQIIEGFSKCVKLLGYEKEHTFSMIYEVKASLIIIIRLNDTNFIGLDMEKGENGFDLGLIEPEIDGFRKYFEEVKPDEHLHS
jgi:hypothetical protein